MSGNSEGRRRLNRLLGIFGGAACALAMAMVLVLYGTPYQMFWWWVMAGVLAASVVAARLLAPTIEWVIEGYRGAEG